MAATPPKSTAPQPKPEPAPVQLTLQGIPPKPNMAEPPASLFDEDLGEVVNAELEAGRKALENNKARANAEYEAGRKAIARFNRNSESKE